ncbi:MAG: hypothetical protein OEZ44_07470 [Candidatus Bathyarchaeota archaeon]|nr:hypothetical protein [Candidatus Bathyarchaeota archaeon]
MGPKVNACIRYLDHVGKMVIITSLEKTLEALRGESGTEIIMSNGDM